MRRGWLTLALLCVACGSGGSKFDVGNRLDAGVLRFDANISMPGPDAMPFDPSDQDAGRLDASPDPTPQPDAGSVDSGAGNSTEDAGDADAAAGNPDDPFAEARQVCVDVINEYRASLGLDPVRRATEQEACSDEGAQQDADNNAAHSSAGNCPGLGAQNTCPGWRVGGGFGSQATVAAALEQCLAQMWAEDEPPQGREACVEAYFEGDQECFLAHGHYLNMSDPDYGSVACGFYEMADGRIWMNQDFGR